MAESGKQDAVALLKQDHRTVEDLFEQFEKAGGEGRKQKLAQQICLELSVHAMIEEEIFYPACEGKVEEDLLQEAYVEHDGAKILIAQIQDGDGQSDEFFDAKVKVLQEQIEHHVEEEEQRMDGMFAQARKGGVDMDALGEQMTARKEELMTTFKSTGVPKPVLTTMDQVL
ncbi:MAG: hemerythrin domain-containing protein [Sphingomonas sp.]|nr:hemerythrin domain-containing protein [Sphingomonas sp.]